MERLFFLLSGEHDTLPLAELRAILEGEGYDYRLVAHYPQLALVEAPRECVESVVERAAYVREGGLEVTLLVGGWARLDSQLQNVELDRFLPRGSKIEVRAKAFGGAEMDVPEVEREIGASLIRARPGIGVDLASPSHRVRVLSSAEVSLIGIVLWRKEARPFHERRAGSKPFSLPTSLQPKFARCMVNLSRGKAGDILIDPFAGTGSILVEASLMGFRPMGLEFKKWICRGATRNLEEYLPDFEVVINADARHMPLRKPVDIIVTDPPYGKSSTTLRMPVDKLIREFLHEASTVLRSGGHVCVSSPSEVNLLEMSEDEGFEVVESHLARVHGSLTRKVAVLRKP